MPSNVNRPLTHAEELAIGDSILTTREVVTMNLLNQAMADARTVSFIYDGKNKTVEVHAIGTSTKDGSLIMRGYQVAGIASRKLPIWALYTVKKIEGLSLDFVDSQAPREGYAQNDAQMDKVIAEIAL